MRFALVLGFVFVAACGGQLDAGGAPDASADLAGEPTPSLDLLSIENPQVDAAPVGCGSDAVEIPVGAARVCMDRYEAPNEPGASPLAMQNALDGEAWCAARGKRLCSEAEWVRACNGTTTRPFPYGTTYKRGTCTDDKTWISPNWTTLGMWPSAAAKAEAARLYQADASGLRSGCVSEEGVRDLTGNVAEWVRRSFANANNYDHVMKGCYWAGCYGGTNPNCSFVNPAHPSGFRTYEAGFRCCRDIP